MAGNRSTFLVLVYHATLSPATTNSSSAFEKDGVRRARRSYIFVHFIYGVHDNYTN